MKPIEAKRLMDRRLPVILADFAEKLFYRARRLIDVNNSARRATRLTPHMRNLARNENALAGPQSKLLLGHVKLKLTVDNVDPLILIAMQMLRPARIAVELK